ncbi:MAG: hypothetical protein AAB848_01200 [Patescibacteria group bacterium]
MKIISKLLNDGMMARKAENKGSVNAANAANATNATNATNANMVSNEEIAQQRFMQALQINEQKRAMEGYQMAQSPKKTKSFAGRLAKYSAIGSGATMILPFLGDSAEAFFT